ncbi:MAG: DNA-3-methyladenine glycosylase I [Acidimicrobiales bacterium]
MRQRCEWALSSSPAGLDYHDQEWGAPERDERRLFELLTLEGAQAGLAWETVLAKRAGYRALFSGFDPSFVARLGGSDVDAMLLDPRIIRHRAKIESVIANARAIESLRAGGGSLSSLLWSFVDGTPLQAKRASVSDLPAFVPLAAQMARELKSLGFQFIGPTTCYSLMQAAGLVNDHTTDCFRWAELSGESEGESS